MAPARLAWARLAYMVTRRVIGGDERIAAAPGERTELHQSCFDDARYVSESNVAVEEESHRLLVRRIEYCRRRAAATPRLDAEAQRREVVVPNALEGERRARHRIVRSHTGIFHTIRMGERVEHWKLHRRGPELRKDASIDEFNERMDDALRMDHHLDPVVRNTEQEMRLDDLERLVGERRAVDGDLSSHSPRRMTEGVIDRGPLQTLARPVAKRAARCRENDATHLG